MCVVNTGTPLFSVLGAQPFNYTDAIDVLPNGIHAFAGPGSVSGPNAFINTSGFFEDPSATDAVTFPGWDYHAPNFNHSGFVQSANQTLLNTANQLGSTDFQSSVSDAGTFVLTETSLDMHCWGENPVVTAKLQLNGQDRFSEREGTYFDLVQPFQHHTRTPDTGINVYSFALRPEEHQPSGTCNFSRIDNATLQLVLSNATVGGTNTAKVRVYATNYNVLRIMSGMGGLAYSN